MLAKRAGALVNIICFDSEVVEEGGPYGKSPLGVLVLLNHPGDKVLETVVNGVGLSYRDVVNAKVPVDLLFGQGFELDHLLVVDTAG